MMPIPSFAQTSETTPSLGRGAKKKYGMRAVPCHVPGQA